MKKFTKVCLILAAILAVLGISFCIVSAAVGVDFRDLRKLAFYERLDQKTDQKAEPEGKEFQKDFTGIRKLELELGITDMNIVNSADDQIHVYGSNLDSSFQCRKDEDTLEIESKRSFRLSGNQSDLITLEVPEGMVFEEVELNMGMGSLNAEILNSRKLDIECGVGSVVISGRVEETCEIECGVGEVTLNLDNGEEDFNYQVECGIGSVTLGENSYSGISKEKEINNQSHRTVGAHAHSQKSATNPAKIVNSVEILILRFARFGHERGKIVRERVFKFSAAIPAQLRTPIHPF